MICAYSYMIYILYVSYNKCAVHYVYHEKVLITWMSVYKICNVLIYPATKGGEGEPHHRVFIHNISLYYIS